MVSLLDVLSGTESFLISVRFDDSDNARWSKVHNDFMAMLNKDYEKIYHYTTSLFIVKDYSADIIMDKIKECGANENLDHVMVMNIHASKALFLGAKQDYDDLMDFIPTFIRV